MVFTPLDSVWCTNVYHIFGRVSGQRRLILAPRSIFGPSSSMDRFSSREPLHRDFSDAMRCQVLRVYPSEVQLDNKYDAVTWSRSNWSGIETNETNSLEILISLISLSKLRIYKRV